MHWGVANRIEQINGDSGLILAVPEVTIAAQGGTTESTLRVPETDVLWTASVAVASTTFAHRLELKSENRQLENDFVRSENFWGTVQRPLRHPPKYLNLNAELVFQFINTGTVSNTIALYLYGKRAETCGAPGRNGRCPNPNCRCDRARWGQGRGLMILHTAKPVLSPYAQGGIAVPASAPVTSPLKVPDYYHFRCTILNGQAYSNAEVANALWRGNIQRMDPRDERMANVASGGVRANGLVGTAQNPNYLPSPFVYQKASQIAQEITDLSAAANNVHIAHIGETIDDELLALEYQV